MKVTSELFCRLSEAFNRMDLVATPEVRHAVEDALADVPEPLDAPAIEAFIDVQAERIAELEAKLARVRDAHERYQRSDLDREEFEGTIAAVAEGT